MRGKYSAEVRKAAEELLIEKKREWGGVAKIIAGCVFLTTSVVLFSIVDTLLFFGLLCIVFAFAFFKEGGDDLGEAD